MIVGLLDADGLAGEDLAEIDLAPLVAVAATSGAAQGQPNRLVDLIPTTTARHVPKRERDLALPDLSKVPPRHRRRPDTGIWRTRDGGFIATSDTEPRYWERFCKLIDRPGYIGRQLGSDWHDRIVADLTAIFATRDRAEWERLLEEAGTQFAPVLSVEEALNHPQNRARGMVHEFLSENGATLRQLGHPAGPTLARGAHTLAVVPGRQPGNPAGRRLLGRRNHEVQSRGRARLTSRRRRLPHVSCYVQ